DPRPLIIDYRQQFEPGQAHPPFVTVSAGNLLSGAQNQGLAGKVVLIGFCGIEVSDRLVKPLSDPMPMPRGEINANVPDMLLSGRKLTRLGLLGQLLLVAAASALFLWVVACNPGARGLLLLAGIMIAGYFAAYLLFLDFHRLISYAPVLVAGLLAAPIAQL